MTKKSKRMLKAQVDLVERFSRFNHEIGDLMEGYSKEGLDNQELLFILSGFICNLHLSLVFSNYNHSIKTFSDKVKATLIMLETHLDKIHQERTSQNESN